MGSLGVALIWRNRGVDEAMGRVHKRDDSLGSVARFRSEFGILKMIKFIFIDHNMNNQKTTLGTNSSSFESLPSQLVSGN